MSRCSMLDSRSLPSAAAAAAASRLWNNEWGAVQVMGPFLFEVFIRRGAGPSVELLLLLPRSFETPCICCEMYSP